ncbi:MAG: hypothetical protein H7Z41_14255 [Cytophagales bacterium]|nr:hypothetical protein [Armatimonadota bacterium]
MNSNRLLSGSVAGLAWLLVAPGRILATEPEPPAPIPAFGAPSETTGPRQTIGTLLGNLTSPLNNETSGIAVSRRNRKWGEEVFWVHNDSGDGPFLYAISRDGDREAVVKLPVAKAVDWEDMAWGPGPDGKGDFLYIGDIGDNNRSRTDCVVYRIAEPKLPDGLNLSSKEEPLPAQGTMIARRFVYPDGPHDAETLLVHPRSGVVYLVTKERNGLSSVYRFPPERAEDTEKAVTLVKVATLTVPEEFSLIPRQITGGSISPDGRRVAFCTYASGYEMTLPASATDFDAIWKTPLRPFNLPPLRQTEALCFARDGRSVIVTSEGTGAPLYAVKR